MTIHLIPRDVNRLKKRLEKALKEFFKWFDDNLMKNIPGKCHFYVSTNDNVAIKTGNFQIEDTKREKLLRIQLDNKMSFDFHYSEIYKKSSRKLYALCKVTTYLSLSKRNNK